jgi:hypothetical protein
MCLGICCHLSLKALLDSYLVAQLALELLDMLLHVYLVLVGFRLVLAQSILQLIYLKVQLVVYSLDLPLVRLLLLLKGLVHFLELLAVVMAVLLEALTFILDLGSCVQGLLEV